MPQPLIWSAGFVEPLTFPEANTLLLAVMVDVHDRPTWPLLWMVTRLIAIVLAVGGFWTRMPPHLMAPAVPDPLLLTVLFLMSNAAPLSKMPPPGLLTTAQVSRWRVVPAVALIPIPLAGLAIPWIVRLRR